MPLVTIQKDMDLSEVVFAREKCDPRPSWCSIFTKAYGIVVAERPEFRRAYFTFPWARLFEYSASSADVAIESCFNGEKVLAFAPVRRPECWRLNEMDTYLASCKQDPVSHITTFRRGLKLGRWPQFIRRLALWWILNVLPLARYYYFGTFGVTSVGNWGVDSLRPIAPAISILHYGSINDRGQVSVRLTYDHRVLDGSGPASALVELENVLKTEIVAELNSLRRMERMEPQPITV